MILKFWMAIILSLLCVALFIAIGSFFGKKIVKQGVGGGLIGFFLGFGLFLFIILGPSRVYIVTGYGEYDHYVVVGGPEYTLPDGNTIPLHIPTGECLVINESDSSVVIETVKYGGYGFSGSTQWIHSHSYDLIDQDKIYYFYDNEPPEEISVKDDSEQTVRMWIRNRRI